MVQYYYDKFTAISNTSPITEEYAQQWTSETYNNQNYTAQGYNSYTFDKSTGKFATSGSIVTIQGSFNAGTVYAVSGNTLHRYVATLSVTMLAESSCTSKLVQTGGGGTYYTKGSLVQSNIIAEDGKYPANGRYSDGYWYVKGLAVPVNNKPTLNLTSPGNNQTLYENDTLNISGDAYDQDKDQSVTVYYQINNEAKKVLATNISQKQIPLSKQLIFKGGKLFDGNTALTETLADGVEHKLKVWAVDSENASSTVVERTFYVVPNRAPLLSVDAVVPSGIIDLDKFKISGKAWDEDANSSLKVTRRINANNSIEIYSGPGGEWEFEVSLSQLVVGQNTVVVEVVDNYGAKTSKTIKLNKNEVKTPILQSVTRYKINPPSGSARGVLLWIQRDKELDLTVELSMTLKGEQEQYTLLELDPKKILPVAEGIVEDEYYHETIEPKDNIILKLTTSRANINIDHKIYLIMGVVE
ncbi:hypothetical protein [Lysinibacillus sp. RC79]|uniref:hypothetical protein n=1 Tax=Lysinibacillus sp. RC79 TaxID=3156296 RepID=UPI0035196BFC